MVTLTGILRRLGPYGRRLAWDLEFRKGAYFSGKRSPILVQIIGKYCEGKDVVELACGDGSLAKELAKVNFRSYHGFDISKAAVNIAQRMEDNRYRFAVADMESWSPNLYLDVLIIEEAIYYLDHAAQRALIHRVATRIRNSGCVIIAFHSVKKFSAVIVRIREFGQILEEFQDGDRYYMVLSVAMSEP